MPDEPKKKKAEKRHVHVKVSDEKIGGVYSNHMVVAHTREEFFLDFMLMLPNMGTLVSRVVVSPGHMKRTLRALADNVSRYERKHGTIDESVEPPTTPAGPVPESIN
jgi:hypothetical protein